MQTRSINLEQTRANKGKRNKVDAVALLYLLPYTHSAKLRIGLCIIQFSITAESEARLCGEKNLLAFVGVLHQQTQSLQSHFFNLCNELKIASFFHSIHNNVRSNTYNLLDIGINLLLPDCNVCTLAFH